MRTAIVHDQPVMNYSRITPFIWLGTNACCQMHFDLTLLRQGIRADLSVEGKRIDAPQGVQFYLWLPTPDHTAPTQRALDLGSRAIDWFGHQKLRLYIHCKNGHGRGPTTLVAYFIRYAGKNLAQAVMTIKTKRPEIHLEPGQVAALKKFQRSSHALVPPDGGTDAGVPPRPVTIWSRQLPPPPSAGVPPSAAIGGAPPKSV